MVKIRISVCERVSESGVSLLLRLAGHPDVKHGHVRLELAGLFHSFTAIGSLGANLPAGLDSSKARSPVRTT